MKPAPPTRSTENLPAFNAASLIEADNKPDLEKKNSRVGSIEEIESPIKALLPKKTASKEVLRGLWGGNSTNAQVDLGGLLNTFMEVVQVRQEVKARYTGMSTAAPKKVFENFDFIYSGGKPKVCYDKIDDPPTLIAGEWSTKVRSLSVPTAMI